MLCRDTRQRKQQGQMWQEQANYNILCSVPSCPYAGNLSFFHAVDQKKKHDACEAAENGGGVRQAGRHASEREWRGERRRGGRRGTARASFAMGEESIVWGDWLSRSVASPPVRGSSEDAPLNWEGIHSLGVCIERSAITSCKDRDSAAEAFSTPSALLLFSSLSCSHELSASSSLGQHVHLQPAQWLHARSPEAWPCSASFTCHQHPCQVSHSWAHTSSHFPCSGEETPAISFHQRWLL